MSRMKKGAAIAASASLAIATALAWQAARSPRAMPETTQLVSTGQAAPSPATAASLPADAHVSFGTWTHVGPSQIAGPAQDIAVDPATGHLYAVSPQGWVFRSTDGAGTWTAVKRFDTHLALSRLELQTDAGAVVAFVGMTVATAYDKAQLLRMTPDGQTTRMPLEPKQVRASGTGLYVANDDGLWFSDDNGGYWSQVIAPAGSQFRPYCTDVEIAGSTVFATCNMYDSYEYRYARGVFRSVNGGAFARVWSPPAELSDAGWLGAAQLAASKSNPAVVYVAYARGSSMTDGAYVYRTTDGGTSWELRTDPTSANRFNGSLLTDFEERCKTEYAPQGSAYVFEVDPSNPDLVWIGALELYRSNDGGLNFGRASLATGKGEGGYVLPRDIHALRFSRAFNGGSNRAMYVATELGVYSSADARAAVQTWSQTTCATAGTPPSMSWTQRIKGYSTIDFAAVDVTPAGDVLATLGSGQVDPFWEDLGRGSPSTGLFYGALDDPQSWGRLSHVRPKRLSIDPVSGMDRFHTSRCVGATLCRWDWSEAEQRWNVTAKRVDPYNEHPQDLAFFMRDPSSPSRFWGGETPLSRSDDAMGSWTSAGSTYDPEFISAGAVSPANPNLVLLGDGEGRFYRRTDALSANAGTVWNGSWMAGSFWSPTDIRFDPRNPNRVFAVGTSEPSVLVSTDAGQTWQQADRAGADDGLPSGPTRSLAPDPINPDVLYAASGNRLYVTWNYRATSAPAWHAVPTPFEGASITRLLLRQGGDGTGTLYAFTAGRGIWAASVKVQRFDDVPFDRWTYDAIERLARSGITGGCASNPQRFCPTNVVSRDQMAVFLLRAKHGRAYQPPAASGDFSDVPTTHWAAAWIERLRDEGITGGCGTNPLRYCPTDTVRRDQMAVFLLRAKHGASYQPPAATGVFADVPASHWAAAWIEQLAREGIGGGCSTTPKNFCPASAVTREQMAVFLVRAFGL